MSLALQTYGARGLGATPGEVVADLVTRGKAREVAVVATLPTGVREVTAAEAKAIFDPLFKRPLFWVAVGGGLVVIIGGFLLVRRRRRRR